VSRNEDGEFELVLGNRQLLTVFFIVVVLFGIFFAMGYILGRPASTAEATTSRKTEKPLTVESPARDSNPAPTKADAPPPPEAPKPVKTEPEKAAKAEPPKPEPAPKAEAKTEPKQAAKQEKPRLEPAKPATPATGQPAPGNYLQLAAIGQQEATLYVDVLRKKGFKSIAVQHPDKPLFRVLVGPLAEGTMAKTKSDLKAAGFPGDRAVPQKYQ
jgi:hypothetical protein